MNIFMNIFFKNAETADIAERDWKRERASGILLVASGTLVSTALVCKFAMSEPVATTVSLSFYLLLVGVQQIYAAWFLRRFSRMEKMLREIQATAKQNAKPGVD